MDPLLREIETQAATLRRLRKALLVNLTRARRRGVPWRELAALTGDPESTIRHRVTQRLQQRNGPAGVATPDRA